MPYPTVLPVLFWRRPSLGICKLPACPSLISYGVQASACCRPSRWMAHVVLHGPVMGQCRLAQFQTDWVWVRCVSGLLMQ